MNDEQNHQEQQETAPDFGKIQITPPCSAARARPRSSTALPPRQKKSARKAAPARRPPPGRARWPGLLALALLLTLPALFVLFCLFGLPLLIKGPLAERLSVQLGRPVSISEASLSPFSLDLHLAEIAVGTEASKPDEPELVRIETADARIRPAALLRGKVVLEDVRLDRLRATLIRRTDGSFSSPSADSGLALVPDWLLVQGLRLSRGTVHFLDQPSGRKHLIEQIEFVLPNADGEDKAVEPVLSAVVNSSPVQIKGRRSGTETRLALTLNDLDPQQYLGWLPGLAEAATVSADRADAVLELIVHDQAEQGMALSGTLTASGLLIQSAENDATDEGFRLAVPKAKAVLRTSPLRSQYAVEELSLEEPLLELAGKADLNGRQLVAQAAALLNSGGISLTVDKLSLRKGTVKNRERAWTDVQIDLTGFQNAEAAETADKKTAAVLSLSAKGGRAAVSLSGEADSAFSLSGTVDLKNMEAGLLQPYLADERLRLAQGAADISGTLRLDGQGMSISGSTVGLRDFVLQRNKAALVSGKALNGADCALDGPGRSISCGRIALDQADFAAEAPALFLSGGWRRISSSSVEIRNSAALLPLAGTAPLALSGLNLSMDGQNKLQLAASVGEHGRAEISGALTKADSGLALSGRISLQNVDAGMLNSYLSQGAEIGFGQGRADISGTGSLTAGAGGIALGLSGGAISVRDFVLQHSGAGLVTGKTLNGSGCALNSSGLTCGKLALSQADFTAAAPAFFLQPAGQLKFSAKNVEIADSAALLPLGSGMPLPLSGLTMSLNSGTLRLNAAASGGSINAEGPLDQHGSGTLALTAAGIDLHQFSRAAAGLFRNGLVLKQGSLSCKGQLALPGGRFSGEFSLDQLAAESSRGDVLRWQRLAGSGAAVVLSPFSSSAERLFLQEPSIRMASADNGIAAGLLALLADVPLLSSEQCSLASGSLELEGGTGFRGIEGTIVPFRPGSEAAFALAGKMNGSDFHVKGKADSGSVVIDELTIERLPLIKAAQDLAAELGADSEKAQVSRTVSPSEDRLDLSGIVPHPDSAFALALALLTNAEGGFSLPLQNVPAGASESAVGAAAAEELRRFRLQAAAAPEKLLPGLADLPRSIDFLPGDKVPDFMRGLEGYVALFTSRPHLALAVRGCFDKEADRKQLLAQFQKEEESRVKEANLRREEEMRRLIAEEVVRQQTLHSAGKPIDKDNLPEIRKREELQPLSAKQTEAPDTMLADMAHARAEVIREQLVGRLNLPPERVKMQESGSCGARAELRVVPVW